MTPARLSPTSDRALNLPCFPAKLFLDIFSYANRSTLAALCLVDPTFLGLVTPLLYHTAHINDLPLSNAPRTPRLAELVPSLAYSSVRTLLISPSDDDPPLPQLDLPKLVHLHIHVYQPRHCRFYTSFDSCASFLYNLDPPHLTLLLR
jgi:hypothetical protein